MNNLFFEDAVSSSASGVNLSMISTICTVVFFVIIGLIVIGSLLSMKKGLAKNIYRLVWNGIMVVLGIFLTRPISATIATTDISAIGSISMGGSTISPTTVLDTVEQIVVSLGGSDPSTIQYIAVHDESTMSLIAGLSSIIISYVVFIVWMLLTITIFALIGQILWGIIFKRLFDRKQIQYKKDLKAYKKHKTGPDGQPVEKPTKPRKFKLIGLGLSLVNGCLMWFMCLSPLTSLVNTASVAVTRYESKSTDEDPNYAMIKGFVEAYNSSVLGQAGALTADVKGSTLDAKLMDFVTYTTIDGKKIEFNSELAGLLKVGLTLLDSGLLSSGSSFDMSKLSTEMVSSILKTLAESGLFNTIIKIAANVAVNYGDVKGYLDSAKVDLSNTNWATEINNIDAIYQAVYNTGVLDGLSTKQFHIPVDKTTEADKITSFKSVLSSIDNSDALSKIVPAVLYKLANKVDEEGNATGLGKYLASDWAAYNGLEIGHEVSYIYDFAVNLYEKAEININDFLGSSTGGTTEEDPGLSSRHNPITKGMEKRNYTDVILYQDLPSAEDEGTSGETGEVTEGETGEESSSSSPSIINQLLDNVDDVIPLITGTGTTGHPAAATSLLDSKLIVKSFPKLFTLITDMLTSTSFGADVDKAQLKTICNSLDTKAKIATELDSVLRAAKYLMVDANLMGGGLDLSDSTKKTAIVSAAVYLDESKLFSYMMPTILKSMASSLSFGGIIEGTDLNFDNIQFAKELPTLVDLYDGFSSIGSIDSINSNDLKDMLNDLCGSKIFNVINGGALYESNVRKNFSAFENIIAYILKLSTLDTFLCADGADEDTVNTTVKNIFLGINNELADPNQTGNDWLDTLDSNNNVTAEGEISKLVKVINNFKSSGLSSLDASSIGSTDMQVFGSLLKSVNDSKVLTGAMPRLFKMAFETVGIESYCSTTPDYELSSVVNKKAAYDTEVDILVKMVESLQVDDGTGNKTMFDFTGSDQSGFSSFINNGGTLSAVIEGLDQSKILGSNNGSIFVNLFGSVGANSYIYPYAGTDEQKIATMNSLFAKSDFQATIPESESKSVEGAALDKLICALSSLESVDLNSATATSIAPILTAMKDCISASGTNRAFIASELFAGAMQSTFDSLSSTLSANHVWRDNNYELVCHRSAEGMLDALQAKDAYNEYYAAPNDATKKAAFRAAMVDLDSYNTSSASDAMINDLIDTLFLSSSSFSVNGQSISTIIAGCTTYEAKADAIITAMNLYAMTLA